MVKLSPPAVLHPNLSLISFLFCDLIFSHNPKGPVQIYAMQYSLCLGQQLLCLFYELAYTTFVIRFSTMFVITWNGANSNSHSGNLLSFAYKLSIQYCRERERVLTFSHSIAVAVNVVLSLNFFSLYVVLSSVNQ